MNSVNIEINSILSVLTEDAGKMLEDCFCSVFPKDKQDWIVNCIARRGNYVSFSNTIEYIFRCDSYLINKMEEKYRSMIYERVKHDFSFKFTYDILFRNFTVGLYDCKLITGQSIRNETLRNAIHQLMCQCGSIVSNKKFNIVELKQMLLEVKCLLDNYESFYTAERLIEN
ncbi:hypothetical protein D3C71_1243170 [compost metagenome]